MKTRTIILLLAALCLTARGFDVYADESKAAPASPAAATAEADKVKALDEMAALGPKAAEKIMLIEGGLRDQSPVVRAHAALALGAIGPAAKDSVSALAELLKDPDGAVRRSALHALKAIHPGPKVMVPMCAKMIEDADPMIRARILNAIAMGGKDSVPGLIAALTNEKACFWSLIVLREIGPDAGEEAVRAIVDVLKNDKRPEIRREAVLTLGAMGKAAESALPELAKLLNDEHCGCAATFVMGELGQIPKDAEATVRANIKSKNEMLSTASLWALARVHPEDEDLRRETTEKLIERLKDKDAFVRAAAARALAALPPAPKITGQIWDKAMKGADENTVHMALGAMASLGAQAVPRLTEALKYEKYRPEILYTLGRIGPDAAPATAEIAKLVEDKNSRVGQEAIIALGDIGPRAKDAVPALVKALSQAEDRDMNFTAIAYALGKIRPSDPAAEATLEDKLTSKNGNVRVMSGWALAQISGTSATVAAKAVPVLKAALSLSDEEDRLFAAEALGGFGPLAKDAAEALKKATSDPDKNVDEAAAAALRSVEVAAPGSAQPAAAAPAAPASPASADYKPGDQVVTAKDDVEIGVAGKQGQSVPKGTKLRILEIRGSWIGVRAEMGGKTYNGWVLAEQISKP